MTTNVPDSNTLTRAEIDAMDGQAQVLIAQGTSRGLAGVVRTGETIARLVAHVRALEVERAQLIADIEEAEDDLEAAKAERDKVEAEVQRLIHYADHRAPNVGFGDPEHPYSCGFCKGIMGHSMRCVGWWADHWRERFAPEEYEPLTCESCGTQWPRKDIEWTADDVPLCRICMAQAVAADIGPAREEATDD